jgi:tRNA (cmo5U34)-methyltransferase
MPNPDTHWSEDNTRAFLDRGKYFVFEREYQMETLLRLIPDPGCPFQVLELCCGEGLLAEQVLARWPSATVRGLDGSPGMLEAASQRLARFGQRFSSQRFDLAEPGWRDQQGPTWAVLSSLAIHHLDDAAKAQLFRDVYRLLEPGGVFLIADLIRQESALGMAYAGWAYDEAVRLRALELDGDERAFAEFKRLEWNYFYHPDDPSDHPSTLPDQLRWLENAGFRAVDVYWVRGGHAIFGASKG